jgi:hypothetical protein
MSDFYRELDAKEEGIAKARVEQFHAEHPNLHDYQGCENDPAHLQKRIADLERQLAEAQATIAALQWTPITPDNLPKVGDEAYSGNDGDFLYVHSCDLGTAQEWTNEGWTHFLHISPPTQARAAEVKREE